jgi:hypothetical protein
MIICLEGPSAVGKTTMCAALAEQSNAFVVPEVNALFERPAQASADWYLERQVERWEIAQKHSVDNRLVVLDGDVFQPLWYNWSFGFAEYQPLEALSAFYQPRIEAGIISFPDHYVPLFVDENELRLRKEADQTRTRRGFDSHLRLLQTQPRYFEMLAGLMPGKVHSIEAKSVETNLRHISERSAMRIPAEMTSLEVFDKIVEWLQAN